MGRFATKIEKLMPEVREGILEYAYGNTKEYWSRHLKGQMSYAAFAAALRGEEVTPQEIDLIVEGIDGVLDKELLNWRKTLKLALGYLDPGSSRDATRAGEREARVAWYKARGLRLPGEGSVEMPDEELGRLAPR